MARRFLLEVIGLPEHLCLITAHTAVYALINQGSFAEMGWIIMNLSVGIFPLQAQIMEQNRPSGCSVRELTAGSCFLKHHKGHCR
jgi:hypothetical protein